MTPRHPNRRPPREVMKPRRHNGASRDHVNARGKPKHRFSRRGAAEFVSTRPHLRPYRCPICGAWHVTHQPKDPR